MIGRKLAGILQIDTTHMTMGDQEDSHTTGREANARCRRQLTQTDAHGFKRLGTTTTEIPIPFLTPGIVLIDGPQIIPHPIDVAKTLAPRQADQPFVTGLHRLAELRLVFHPEGSEKQITFCTPADPLFQPCLPASGSLFVPGLTR
ncbi:hypothetical protein J8Z04_03465 [Bombella apis]|nr:hypothetical protein [Bombella apis]MBR9730340.1 hypothetical protein [Bombella apis]